MHIAKYLLQRTVDILDGKMIFLYCFSYRMKWQKLNKLLHKHKSQLSFSLLYMASKVLLIRFNYTKRI